MPKQKKSIRGVSMSAFHYLLVIGVVYFAVRIHRTAKTGDRIEPSFLDDCFNRCEDKLSGVLKKKRDRAASGDQSDQRQ